MPITPKQMEKLLVQNGFVPIRQRGSHKIMFNKETNRTVPIPMHRKDLKIGTEQALLKSD